MVLLREQLLDNRSFWNCPQLILFQSAHSSLCVGVGCFQPHVMQGWRKNLSVIHQCFQGGWFLSWKKTWITKHFFSLHPFQFHVWFGNYCCRAWQCQYIYYLFSFAIFPVGVLSHHYNHLWMLEMMMIIIFPFLCCLCTAHISKSYHEHFYSSVTGIAL